MRKMLEENREIIIKQTWLLVSLEVAKQGSLDDPVIARVLWQKVKLGEADVREEANGLARGGVRERRNQ